MSNALFCDTCGNVFPEDAEGSVSGNGTFTRTVDGVRKQLQRRTDQCPECAQAQAQRWNGARTLEEAKIHAEINQRVRQSRDFSDVPDIGDSEAYKRASGAPGYGA